MTKRYQKRQIIHSDYEFYGDLSALIEDLNNLIKTFGESVSVERVYYGYDGGYDLEASYLRDESDEERRLRVEEEAKDLAIEEKKLLARRKRELKQLAKLKEKYEEK